jgi:polyisoprenoid-binding protein YceI
VAEPKPNESEASMSTQSAAARTTPIVPPGTWHVDPVHSSVEFAVKHMGIATVRGKFTQFEGTLEVGQDLPSSRAYGKVIVASITTDEPDRDAHLRSPDFFDAESYPEITFSSTRIQAQDEESTLLFGDLTMHGVTREVRIDVVVAGTDEDPWGNTRVGLEAVAVIKRSDFDMKFNQALGSGNMLVGDKVTISLDISAVKQPLRDR